MRRAILTGATGAIGLALIRELIDDGVEVLVLCHKGSKRTDRIPVSPLVELKDCSLDDLAGLTNDTGKEYDVFCMPDKSATIDEIIDFSKQIEF